MTYRVLKVHQAGVVMRLAMAEQSVINGALIDDLNRALDAAERSPACRVVALSGREGVFSVGMDFTEAGLEERGDGAARGGEAFFDLLRRFTTVPRAVVCVVDGRVAGGGTGLAAASDLVYATPRSELSLPEALWGLLPCCVLPFVFRRAGFQAGYAMTLTTQPVPAGDALRRHLVDAVDERPEILLSRLAQRLARVDESVIGDLKRYCGRLHPIPADARDIAVGELSLLMAQPLVQARIENFVRNHKFPWEH
jgi:polyketide biosynthesis enoyl-CoA hydratase PksH